MKVILVTPGLVPHFGGSAVSEASLAGSLAQHCDVTVWCRRGLFDPAFAGALGVERAEEFTPSEILQAWLSKEHRLCRQLRSAQVLHLNGHWKWENFFIASLCRRYRVPYVLHPRGMFLVGHRRRRMKKIFNALIGHSIMRGAARIIALSQFETRQFDRLPIEPSKVVVIPNGIPLVNNRVDETRHQRLPFLYIGRIELRKNLVYLVEQFCRYVKSGGTRQLHLVGPVEREYDKAILQRARALGIEDRVQLLSPKYGDKKWDTMRESCAVIYPANEEPFGRVPFEAVSAGAPPILPRQSGGAEYLERFFPECMYDATSPDSLSKALEYASSQRDSVTLSDQILAAQKWIGTELNWQNISKRVVTLYEQIQPVKS